MLKLDSYRTTVSGLAVLAAVMFAYPCFRIFAAFEIDYNEGWNAFLQTLVMTGASPYGEAGPMFFNNYPPLSFYLVGAAGALLGDPVLAGRLFSALSVAVISACCAVVVRHAGGARSDAVFASATCAGMFATFATDYVGVDDPQLLAQAFLCSGFAVYASGRATPARLALVAALFACGLLTKHNVLALPVVVTIHALWRSPAPARWTFLGVGLALIAVASLTIHLLFGPDFFRLLLAPRLYDGTRGFLLTMDMLGRIQTPLALAALFLVLTRSTPIKSKTAYYLGGSLVLGMGFAGGAGVDINIYFDTMIAVAMGCGLAATWLRQQSHLPKGAMAVFALLANAGVILMMPQTLGRIVVDALGEYRQREQLFLDDVAYVKGIEGPAICESMLLCYRAGKGVWVDPYNLLQATLTGRLPTDHLVAMLHRHEAAVFQISSSREHPVDEAPGLQVIPPRFVNFGDPVFDELERSYEVKRVGLSGRFHQPKAQP